MSLESKIISLAQGIGADIKTLTTSQGNLTLLTTTNKASIVAALNELKTLVDACGGAGIDDGATSVSSTCSSTKISTQITAAINAILASAPTALDTLNELAAAIGNDPTFATTIATSIGNRVRYDAAQALTVGQQLQACTNIGVGDPDHNFLAEYAAAKL